MGAGLLELLASAFVSDSTELGPTGPNVDFGSKKGRLGQLSLEI